MDSFQLDLVLVRHAVAHERDPATWPDDARRPLTIEGAHEFAKVARRLSRLAPSVDHVESSAFDRAWATAQILRDEAGWPKPRRAERLELRDGDALGTERLDALVRSLTAMRGLRRVAWVGHEPMLSAFASLLLAGSTGAVAIDFRKGASVAMRFEALTGDAGSAIGRGRLLWMVTPRVVRRLTREK